MANEIQLYSGMFEQVVCVAQFTAHSDATPVNVSELLKSREPTNV